ncbi:MAG TPA: DUF5715 family protein [Candidatus Acidoferrales bacterium]|nr:DUF5715 family protein [Candidatus Acidoferrales bacterium]
MRTPTLARAAFLILMASAVCSARGRDSLLAARVSSQAIQNERADAFHLSRLRDVAMVQKFRAEGLLVSVPSRTSSYYLQDVPTDYRYLRPWSKLFLDRISRDYYARFHEPLRVTSMLRTVSVQRRLSRTNPNAADAIGSDRSSHLTGATLDISKHGMDPRGVVWMRNILLELKNAGYIYPIEEFQEPCFHVMVLPTYRNYAADPLGQATIRRASVRRPPVSGSSVHRKFRRRRRIHHAAHHVGVARAAGHPDEAARAAN